MRSRPAEKQRPLAVSITQRSSSCLLRKSLAAIISSKNLRFIALSFLGRFSCRWKICLSTHSPARVSNYGNFDIYFLMIGIKKIKSFFFYSKFIIYFFFNINFIMKWIKKENRIYIDTFCFLFCNIRYRPKVFK